MRKVTYVCEKCGHEDPAPVWIGLIDDENSFAIVGGNRAFEILPEQEVHLCSSGCAAGWIMARCAEYEASRLKVTVAEVVMEVQHAEA